MAKDDRMMKSLAASLTQSRSRIHICHEIGLSHAENLHSEKVRGQDQEVNNVSHALKQQETAAWRLHLQHNDEV